MRPLDSGRLRLASNPSPLALRWDKKLPAPIVMFSASAHRQAARFALLVRWESQIGRTPDPLMYAVSGGRDGVSASDAPTPLSIPSTKLDGASRRVHKARGRSENVKRRVNGAVVGATAGLAGVAGVSAQTRLHDKFFGGGETVLTDTASAGNGGVATASANGGAVSIGDVNSGGNAGNAIGVGDTSGSVAVDGGDVANLTDLSITANGGTAIADASGGDYNLAFVS